eukprot:1160808-Pelagomonas_calceolata.AAC.42
MSTQGEHGAMGETRLESGRKNFERNQTDVFEVTGSAIGALKEANIRLVRAFYSHPLLLSALLRAFSTYMPWQAYAVA